MRAATIEKRIASLPAISKAGKRINGLHRLLRSPYLYGHAYVKLSKNKGALTPGVDGQTFDGMSLEKLSALAQRVATGTYRFRPARRVHIPKSNGKTRPLGIPAVEDRMVQEAVRIILEAIYEPVFSKDSHGFRPGRSCHTALDTIKRTWTGCKWLIDMDVRGFFDTIDHDILLRLLEKRIDDKHFIALIEAMLKAGYLENWKFEQSYSGTPQGGVVSPLLANIYLHELDQMMADMRRQFDCGKKRRSEPRYAAMTRRINRLRHLIDKTPDPVRVDAYKAKIAHIQAERRKVSSVDPMDPSFKRLRYCRYADDFVIGVIGSKREARDIMACIQSFLETRLKLAIAPEKSGIRDAAKGSLFLGYHVAMTTSRCAGRRANRSGSRGRTWRVVRRPTTNNVRLTVPGKKVTAFCARKGYGSLGERRSRHRPQLLDSSDLEIVTAYNSELRGFATYYALADNVKRALGLLELAFMRSFRKTMAARHRTTVRRIIKKLKKGNDYVVNATVRGKERKVVLWRLKHLDPGLRYGADVDKPALGILPAMGRNDLIKRLNAHVCESCGTYAGPFEVHHLRQMKDMRNEPPAIWKKAARTRKTIVLCRTCHLAAHANRKKPQRESRVP